MAINLRHRVSKPISRMAKNGTLGPELIRAALGIEDAVVSILTDDIHCGGIAERNFSRTGRGSGFEDAYLRRHDVRRNYYDWVDTMKAHKLPTGPVLDIIIEGFPLTGVDRAWKKRKGWAHANLLSALKLYVEMEAVAAENRNRLTA